MLDANLLDQFKVSNIPTLKLRLREFCNFLPETRELQVITVTASCIVDEMINNGKSDDMM